MDAILNYERKAEEDFYQVLGCDESSSVEQITTEYKARVLSCHPDKHPNDPQAAERFALLQKAKDILTDAKQRGLYDCWRRSGIALPYEEWRARKDAVHTAMHWTTSKKSEPMLDHCTAEERSKTDIDKEYVKGWKSESPNDILRKFRNYEI